MSDKEKQYDEEGRVIRENRSQAKRERAEIKALAEVLLKLPSRQFPLLPINDNLINALKEGQRLSGNALKRHLNYLTRLIEEQDFNKIRHAHEHINHPFLRDTSKGKRIENEIHLLKTGDKQIFSVLLARYMDFDLQHVRQLTREMIKFEAQQDQLEAENQGDFKRQVGKHQRQLQKYLQSLALNYEEYSNS